MAFLRYANAVVVQPQVSSRGWTKVRKASANPSRNLVSQASEILGKPFNPDDFLLTHCTIVASVDVEPVPNVKLGRVKVGNQGRTINRKFAEFYIKPECSQFVNNNGDSWSREVLLMAYPTFIGAHNFLEHVQIGEQSKGRIIDAVARDIGDSIYIDILVATDRRHEALVQDIMDEKIGTLSMGCSVEETICTKCGNVAVDETELCECIKYGKLNSFHDDKGKKRVIAELCGHPSLGTTGGVTFIEASWVGTPAFTGAVLRNILETRQLSPDMTRQIQAVLNSPPPQWVGTGSRQVVAAQAAWGDDSPAEGGDAAPAPAAPAPKPPLDVVVEQVQQAVLDRVKSKFEDDLREKAVAEALSPEDSTMSPNDTVIKEAARYRVATSVAYQGAVKALVRTASSDVAFVDGLAAMNRSFGIDIPVSVYRTALQVGPVNRYATLTDYLHACGRVAGGSLSPVDVRVILRIGKLLTQLGSHTPSTRQA